MITQRPAGPVFGVPLSTSSLSTANAWDVLQLTADSSGRLEIVSFDLAIASTQFTTGSQLTLQLLRGSTAASAGSAITPRNVRGWSGAPSANFTAAGPSSGLTSTASAVLIWTGAFDFNGRLSYRPDCRDERIVLTLGQRLNFRTNTPQVAAVVTGSVLCAEIGKGLPS
jgi:hypothetical protein